MSKMFTASINVTEILEQAKKLHSAFSKSQANGKVYCNLIVWENDEPDKFGNTLSFQLNSSKENKEKEGKIYVGNGKPMEKKEPVPVTANDIANLPDPTDDLPF